jgi:hypothetical protein
MEELQSPLCGSNVSTVIFGIRSAKYPNGPQRFLPYFSAKIQDAWQVSEPCEKSLGLFTSLIS